MIRHRSVALGFYQNYHAAQEVLKKLREAGIHNSLSIQRLPSGEIRKNLFAITGWNLAIGATLLMGMLITYFHGIHSFLSLPFLIAAGLFTAWLAYQLYNYFINRRLFRCYKNSVICDETLVLAKVSEKELRKALNIIRKVESYHPTSFLLRKETLKNTLKSHPPLQDPLSTENLQNYAIALAGKLKNVSYKKTATNPLKERLERNSKSMADIRHHMTEAEHLEQSVDLSAEWFLDNMYVLQNCAEDIRRGLSFKYYQELPKVTSGPMAHLPRIYVIARDLIDSTANRLNRENITTFLNSYLTVDDLTSGELWALPMMLKLSLLEHIQALAVHLDQHLHEGELARFWGNRILHMAKREPPRLDACLKDLDRQCPTPSPYFAEELLNHIFDEPIIMPLLEEWVEKKLHAPSSEIIQQVEQRKILDDSAFSSAIISLIALLQLSWSEIFEEMSPVDAILKHDPARIYQSMDFTTRDQYRHALEKVSRGSNFSERDVAEATIKLSQQGSDDITRHVGYYLIDKGRSQLEEKVNCHLTFKQKIQRFMQAHSTLVYLGGIALITVAIEGLLASYSLEKGETVQKTALLMLLALFPASEIGVQLLNFLIPLLIPPYLFPKMEYKNGIPEINKTIVVIPTMLLDNLTTDKMVNQLEIHYLSNPDPVLKFGLLFDVADSKTEETSEDKPLLEHALQKFKKLEEKYGQNKFFLFLRPRVWSNSENAWIGWERKRGKLETLNRFLTGSNSESNFLRFGNRDELNNIRFVITLDSDNLLPKDKAKELIETLSHPLNAPKISTDNTIERGYTIIQPSVSTDYAQNKETLFAKLFSDTLGIDPYTQTTSDVYQDLMHEGTYHGKGIYDLYTFNRILSGRFPDERLLSHDLLEGAYTGVGFASDILIFDQFPKDYLTWTKRQHRWFRGDWQIMDWMFPTIKDVNNQPEVNPLSVINRWKVFDNLRRALMFPAILALLLAAWFMASSASIWTILCGVSLIFPAVASALGHNIVSLRSLRERGKQFWNALVRLGINISLLPHQAKNSLDALIRTVYRRSFSHRKLLEWSVSNASPTVAENTLLIYFLCGVSLLSLLVVFALGYKNPTALPYALPFCLLWFLSPFIAMLIDSKTLFNKASEKHLSHENQLYLRKVGRRTWRYFDDFVGPQSNWMPPDNYQSALNVEIAQRTSPTNIGLWFLTAISAYDLKYLTCDETIDRLEASFQMLNKLELYEGHLLNWYDIQTLKPLLPRYVSTVDNGNFLASLWTLEQAIHQLVDNPIMPLSFTNGLQDTLEALLEEKNHRLPQKDLGELKRMFSIHTNNLLEAITLLKPSIEYVDQLQQRHDLTKEENYWLAKIQQQLKDFETCKQRYFFWIEILSEGLQQDPIGSLGVSEKNTINTILRNLHTSPSLKTSASGTAFEEVQQLIEAMQKKSELPAAAKEWLNRLLEAIHKAQWFAGEQIHRIEMLLGEIQRFSSIDMSLLYNPQRRLFTIGYNVDDVRADSSHYDLLASEARISSLVSIAKGDVPLEHWWALGRPYRNVYGLEALVSWSGTMFEYLMPVLFTRHPEDSLLGNACKNAVACQMTYANRRGIPWGISEAAFSEIDAHKTYQYRSFGVPGLGFKRGLDEDLVVSPYSTAMALTIEPLMAIKNLHALSQRKQSMYSDYGFYESIDFTREQGPQGERGLIVYAYMAHHQGMTLLAINNVLNNSIMVDRFHKNLSIKGVEALLYERIPLSPPMTKEYRKEVPVTRLMPFSEIPIMGVMKTTESAAPKVNLLSNSEYSIMLTQSGGGYSRWRDNDITRWRADTTCDPWGSFCYIKDVETGKFWSSTFQPTGTKGDKFNVHFKADKVEFSRRDEQIETITNITVSPQDNVEIRLVTIANLSKRTRTLELTSYQELALAPHKADRSHPCFNKFFIQTEAQEHLSGILAFRRLRSKDDQPLWAGHVTASSDPESRQFQYETDRNLFIGRGNTLASPSAMNNNLTNSSGYVLDPIFSLRRTITLAPGQRAEVSFVTAMADNREAVIQLLDKYRDLQTSKIAFELAWTHAQLELRHLRIDQEEAQLFQKLASRIIYPHSQLRLTAERLRKNLLGQSRLWSYSISGDLPIIAVTISDGQEIDLVKQILTAQKFWRLRGLKVDCVILNEESYSYEQPLFSQINRMIHSQAGSYGIEIGKPGGIYLLNIEQMPSEDVTLILSVARAHIVAARGYLRQHLVSPMAPTTLPPKLTIKIKPAEDLSKPLPFMELPYFNGLGGFTPDGKEYVIYLGPNTQTPAPWINVISNPQFGIIVSETGLGCTWYGNSQSNRLTNWSNDPLLNPITDVIYIRDDQLGTFWSATPGPIRELDAYRVRHGQGYSCFEHNSHGIEQELTVYVPVDDNGGQSLRIQRLTLKNTSPHKRTLSLFSYTELVMGGDREETQMHLISNWDANCKALFAYNSYCTEYVGALTFAFSSEDIISHTGDRAEFIGRNQQLSNPNALHRKSLSGLTGPGFDPCLATQIQIELEPGEEKEAAFMLGYALDMETAQKMIQQYKTIEALENAFIETKKWWDGLLGTVQIDCPDLFINFSMNKWLLYQNLSCRVWGRSGFYQSSGAYGFRDQLQDVMALLYTSPKMAREQILRAASRQFIEGDVQHWWLPPSNGGVRTKISDDLLWLPFVTAQYIRVTNDVSILSEDVPFIKGEILKDDEHETFFVPDVANETASLLEHCRRAIQKGNTKGANGLPLIGGGDWNDGMNRVGIEGKGESVWLAWFLVNVLHDFAELLDLKDEHDESAKMRAEAKVLAQAIEETSWDGKWYRRAYFDDGSPLGSASNKEDMIDSIPQSWAVISGAGDPERAKIALESVDKHLVKYKEKIVLLLTPAFDVTPKDPGYIKGYPPGIRENGGQYTHGSLWVPLAFARLGQIDKAVEILKMMNPIMHAQNMEEVNHYKIEPYVGAGDVYSADGKMGRGGWSWYTGSVGWMYRIWLEEIFGFQIRGNSLSLNPKLPKCWPSAKIKYQHHETLYQVSIVNSDTTSKYNSVIDLDGKRLDSHEILLVNDGKIHDIQVTLV